VKAGMEWCLEEVSEAFRALIFRCGAERSNEDTVPDTHMEFALLAALLLSEMLSKPLMPIMPLLSRAS